MRLSIRSVLAVIALLVVAVPSAAQTRSALPTDSAKVTLTRQLLKHVGAVDLAIGMMENALPAQRAATPHIPAVFWDRLLAEAKARRGELEDLMVIIYERHFTTDELRQLLAFYQTPIGRKLLASQPSISQESMRAGEEWGGRVGNVVAEQLAKEGLRSTP